MPREKVGNIPDFEESNNDESKGNEEVKEAETDEASAKKETSEESSPKEKPADQEEQQPNDEVSDDTGTEEKAVAGLEQEKAKLLVDIQELRGTRRELREKEKPQEDIKKEPVTVPPETPVNPEDREIIKKVIQEEGFVTKEEVYKNTETEEIDKFLNKYPEYKPENDPTDANWTGLMREFRLYAKPKNPQQIGELLERSRKSSQPAGEAVNTTKAQEAVKTAGMGSGGSQRSSSSKSSLPAGMSENEVREEYRRGGYKEKEIDEMLN